MAESALKFGPEWLRNLSHGNSLTSPTPVIGGTPKYKLSDYRYGREEMLALFEKNTKPPEELKEVPSLLIEKCQIPLALVPMLEDEQRLWARSVNSDAVLRLNSKGVLLERGNGAPPVRGGRGGSVDRGRGRGRGGYYQRGIEYEDGIDAPPGGFSRTRHFERSQSIGEKEQRWNERERRLDRIPETQEIDVKLSRL
ncbi:GRB10-interacting GYF protein 1-like isoform X2 [Tachypleus tridentatus]|uniref:GRB10-interacting GYF protein 1-like isoform X2 n=1 Tax=Tachypleus tridentatus TaxID=6853 RepID=UPI003FD0D202